MMPMVLELSDEQRDVLNAIGFELYQTGNKDFEFSGPGGTWIWKAEN